MKIFRILFIYLLAFICISCNKQKPTNEDYYKEALEEKVLAEYTKDYLLKYDANYDYKLLDKDELKKQEEISKNDIKNTIKTYENKLENNNSSDKKVEKIESLKKQEENVEKKEYLYDNKLKMIYGGYSVYNKKEDKNNILKSNQHLFVVKIPITNDTNADYNYKFNIGVDQYSIVLDGKKYLPLITVDEYDLQTMKKTIKSGKTVVGKLFFALDKNTKFDNVKVYLNKNGEKKEIR